MKKIPFNLSAPFIRRPVATTLLTLAIALLGLVSFRLLPVSPLPQVDYPTIAVTAGFPGASPETMAASVAAPLERSLGRIAGITEMTSSSRRNFTSVVLQFDLERDINGAARDVQAAINAARADLPPLPNEPSYRKLNPADAPIMILAVASDSLSSAQLFDNASTVLAQKASQIVGVGQVIVAGSALPSVRIELNPAALNRAGLSLEAARLAVGAANVNRPKGLLENAEESWFIGGNDQLFTPQDYGELIVSTRDGQTVKLADLGYVTQGAQDINNLGLADGKQAVLIMIFREPGANIIKAVDNVTEILPSLRAWLPERASLDVLMDSSLSIRASLKEMEYAMGLSIALVVLVVFLFLRKASATLIPAVAVPVSLISTFTVMHLCGYSLNNLSLMALTIAAGFVVDDAIVVTENIVRHVENGTEPGTAAFLGAREVGFTVLSISLSLVAVFIPILFMGGIVGRLFHEFAVALSAAVLISLVVSLTTTPMLAAHLLRRQSKEQQVRAGPPRRSRLTRLARLPRLLNTLLSGALEAMRRFYASTLPLALRHTNITLLALFLIIALNIYLYIVVPKGFFPQQDIGKIVGSLRADQSVSFQAMQEKMTSFMDILMKDPAVEHASGSTGGASINSAQIFISLKPRTQRNESADAVINRLRAKLAAEPGARLYLQSAQDIRVGGRSASAQYQYTLRSDDWDALRLHSTSLLFELARLPELRDVNADYEGRGLQTTLALDREAMARLMVNMERTDHTLYDAFGQRIVSTMYEDLNQYRVIMELAPEWRQGPSALERIYVPANNGTLVPLAAFASYSTEPAALSVAHQAQLAAITASFNLAPGVSLSQATAAVERVKQRLNMPPHVLGSFQGTAKAYADTMQDQGVLILATLLTLYIVLGMLYESLIHPLTILSTLPSAGIGALLALLLFRQEFTVITFIAILLLAGIVKKNAILMVDFALEATRARGLPAHEAIEEACLLRFRPIMMTTLAAILGALPLITAGGEGAELRRPLGIAIVGGLLVSQVLTLYTTPAVYLVLDRITSARSAKKDLARKAGKKA